jgi:WhiB family redox-sensing transcriptional regulator
VYPCHRSPDLFFADRPHALERAKMLCHACPVQEWCLTTALDRGEPYGVWGGQIIVDGAVVAFKRGPGRPRKDAAVA